MGLDAFKVTNPERLQGYVYDLQGKSVLDVGGGPVSLLLKCINLGRGVVVDPCKFPPWTRGRYAGSGINLMRVKAEGLSSGVSDGPFDEVWIYNVLQHVEDPRKVLEVALSLGKVVRLFDWLETPVNAGHVHSLTEEMLGEFIPGDTLDMNEGGCVGKAFFGVLDRAGQGSVEAPTLKKPQMPVASGGRARKRFHLLGVAHLPTNKTDALCCAYSQKVLKMAQMLKMDPDNEVIFYGGEGSTVECDEFVQVVSAGAYKSSSRRRPDAMFQWNTGDATYQEFNAGAAEGINARKQDGDILLCSWGTAHQGIANATGLKLVVEMGIGYPAVFAPFKVFESYAWMHHVYALNKIGQGVFFDAVIPNYFDPKDFRYEAKKEDYILYLGRVIPNKGVRVVIETAEALGMPLKVAGQLGVGADYVDLNSPVVEYVGEVGVEARRELLAKAKVMMAPTFYIEPFGGVVIEAYLSGTPVVTTDFGVFPETVLHGKTGFRCKTAEQFRWAVRNIDQISPVDCYNWAIWNYSMERVAKMYEEYFRQVRTILAKGYYEPYPARTELDWLAKEYVHGGCGEKDNPTSSG